MTGCGSSGGGKSSSSGGPPPFPFAPSFSSPPAGGGSTPRQQAETLASFACFGLQFASLTPHPTRLGEAGTYTIDNGSGYTTTVAVQSGELGGTVAYAVAPGGGSPPIYTGKYRYDQCWFRSVAYDGTADWGRPLPSTYSGHAVTHLLAQAPGEDLSAMSGWVSASSGDITIYLHLDKSDITGDARQGGQTIGTYSGSTSTGIVFKQS